MNQPLWSAVDDYWTTKLHAPDDALDAAVADSAAGGLPPIAVTAPMGKFLHLLARAQGARRILEIGTPRRLLDDLARPRAPGRRRAGDL